MPLVVPALPRAETFGLLAEFELAEGALPRPASRCATPATRAGTRTRRSRSTASTARWASAARGCRGSCSSSDSAARVGGFALQIWVNAHRVPARDQRQAALRLAGVRAGHVRARRAARRRSRRGRSACSPSTELPRHYHPLFGSPAFERVTDDRFFISIEAGDPKFDPTRPSELAARRRARPGSSGWPREERTKR